MYGLIVSWDDKAPLRVLGEEAMTANIYPSEMISVFDPLGSKIDHNASTIANSADRQLDSDSLNDEHVIIFTAMRSRACQCATVPRTHQSCELRLACRIRYPVPNP